MEERRVVEIHGTKFEVDLREAHKVETLKVGDRVSILKNTYSGGYDAFNGVVVGFEPFEELPTIVIAYLKSGFGGGDIEVLVFNAKTEDVEATRVAVLGEDA